MWNCVEDRVDHGQFGRIMRRIIFRNVYADRSAVLSEKPIAKNTLGFLKVINSFSHFKGVVFADLPVLDAVSG